jgi:hypothetical protein
MDDEREQGSMNWSTVGLIIAGGLILAAMLGYVFLGLQAV